MKNCLHYASVAALAGLCVFAAVAAEKPDSGTDMEFPPCVVKAQPADRAKDVSFTLQEIKVTFDRPMNTDKTWSWIMYPELGVYPGFKGSPEPRWEDDGKTCVLAVKLSPDTLYAVGINSFRHTGFRDKAGKVAVPEVWVFRTKKAQ